MIYLDRAAVRIPKVIADNHVQITGEGKQQKIIYLAKNHTER